MAIASQGLHEPEDRLGEDVVERHRAIISLIEELEAVDWYDQRIEAASDAELRHILTHNRDEEKEHAAMTLEWLRRRDPELDEALRTHLFREGPIEEAGPESGAPAGSTSGERSQEGNRRDGAQEPSGEAPTSLGLGSLREGDER